MAKRGRPVTGPNLVNKLDGSREAKRRLQVILETIGGERTVASACEELKIGKSRFHELRISTLAGALESLEPRSAGRPAAEPRDVQVDELQGEIDRLRRELVVSEWRTEALRVCSTETPAVRKKKPKRRKRKPR